MTYIRTQKLTPSQAKELVHNGFILELKRFLGSICDEYVIYVK